VIAAGPIAAALTGAGIGAVTGGAIGALTHVGVPEEHAQHYAEGVRRGGTLVTVSSPDVLAPRVTDVMTRYRAVNVSDRAAKWRESGWKGFDASAPALTAEDIRRERALYARRAVDRPLDAADQSAFREGTMEFKETVEEPVVARTVRQRTQAMRDTVKKTEVDVDQDALERLSQPGERRSGEPNAPSRR